MDEGVNELKTSNEGQKIKLELHLPLQNIIRRTSLFLLVNRSGKKHFQNMKSIKTYRRFIILVIVVVILVAIFGLDEDRTVINGIRHFLKALFRAL